jgi:protein-L-isoaspartate(D-aspartate) O-methyltransferase
MGTGDAAAGGDAAAAGAADAAGLRAALVARLRAAGRLRDERVADAFATVPRELFLAGHARRHGLAAVYEDAAVVTRQADDGTATSSSSQPSIMAVMLEMLALRPGARVLEIGAGTGYNAALLAHLVGPSGAVTSVELDPDAAADARRALRSAESPVEVVVGDGHGGWPAAAPVDALVATASVDAIPRAWHEQLAPGGVLVVPLQLARGMFLPQAVVALRKGRQGFDPVASSPGGFMRLRSDVAGGPRDEGVAAGEEAGDDQVERIRFTGPALSGLDGPARRRLVVTALGFSRSEPLPVRWPPAGDLLTYAALALPEERLLAVERPQVLPALGVLDAADGSLAVLAVAEEGLRLESFGGTGAENALRSAADRWNLAGRPSVASARVTVRYGVARPHSWRSTRRGDQWIGLDWAT